MPLKTKRFIIMDHRVPINTLLWQHNTCMHRCCALLCLRDILGLPELHSCPVEGLEWVYSSQQLVNETTRTMDWAVIITRGLVVDKKPTLWTTHPVTDLALEVAGGCGPDLCRSRLDSNSWIRHTWNSSTVDLHVDHQSVLSLASVSSSEGVMSHWFSVVFGQSLYRLYCPPGRRKPWRRCS